MKQPQKGQMWKKPKNFEKIWSPKVEIHRNRWWTYGYEVSDGDFRKDIWESILVSILSIVLQKYRYYIDTNFRRYFTSLQGKWFKKVGSRSANWFKKVQGRTTHFWSRLWISYQFALSRVTWSKNGRVLRLGSLHNYDSFLVVYFTIAQKKDKKYRTLLFEQPS